MTVRIYKLKGTSARDGDVYEGFLKKICHELSFNGTIKHDRFIGGQTSYFGLFNMPMVLEEEADTASLFVLSSDKSIKEVISKLENITGYKLAEFDSKDYEHMRNIGVI